MCNIYIASYGSTQHFIRPSKNKVVSRPHPPPVLKIEKKLKIINKHALFLPPVFPKPGR